PGRGRHRVHGGGQHQRRRPRPAQGAGGAAAAGRGAMNVALSHELDARVRRNEPLSRHTSWHVGGPAEVYFNPRDRDDLTSFLRHLEPNVPIYWVGLGSNLLGRDGGLDGVVISTHGTLDRLERRSETKVFAEAGVACAR